jgi:hypothetical protein
MILCYTALQALVSYGVCRQGYFAAVRSKGEMKEIIINLWNALQNSKWAETEHCFCENAVINWYNGKEGMTVSEYINAHASFTGDWKIEIKRIEEIDNLVVSVAAVELLDTDTHLFVTSFFEFANGKISGLNEYWGNSRK